MRAIMLYNIGERRTGTPPCPPRPYRDIQTDTPTRLSRAVVERRAALVPGPGARRGQRGLFLQAQNQVAHARTLARDAVAFAEQPRDPRLGRRLRERV